MSITGDSTDGSKCKDADGNPSGFCCFMDFDMSDINADAASEGIDFDVGMDQTVSCWSIDEQDPCEAEKTLTNGQACQWAGDAATVSCQLKPSEMFTDERWELCDMQGTEDDCRANDCDFVTFAEDAICAPFSKCTNAETSIDPEDSCKKLDGCSWIAYDDDFADAGLDAPGTSQKDNGFCVHDEYVEEEEWGDIATNGTCLFDVEAIGIEEALNKGFFGSASDNAKLLCRSISGDSVARGSGEHYTAASAAKEVCNGIHTVDGRQECEWDEADSRCVEFRMDPAKECAQYNDDWKCQASDTCRFQSVEYLASAFDSPEQSAASRHIYDDTCKHLSNAQDCESETRPGEATGTLIRACIMAEVQDLAGTCLSSEGGTKEVANPCSLQCIPFNACLLHVTEIECKTEDQFCVWMQTGVGQGASCRSKDAPLDPAAMQDTAKFQDEADYCFGKFSKDMCQKSSDDRDGPPCSWVISQKYTECVAKEGAPKWQEKDCNVIDLKMNLPPLDRERECLDADCLVATTGSPQEYCARIEQCGRINDDAECMGTPKCSWDFVDDVCTEADKFAQEDNVVEAPDLSRAFECFDVPDEDSCTALTFQHKGVGDKIEKSSLCEWIVDGKDELADSDAACNCYGGDDVIQQSVQEDVYRACQVGEGRRRNDAAECMESTCNEKPGCQWMVGIGSSHHRCDVSNAWNKLATQISKETQAESVLTDAFFNCVGKTNFSACLGQFDEDGGQLCTWDNWGDWGVALNGDGANEDDALGNCRVNDKCNVDNRYRCEQVGCSWRPYGNNLQDAYAGTCARKPSESYQGNKDDPDAWKVQFECVPFFADNFEPTTTVTTTTYKTSSSSTTVAAVTATTTRSGGGGGGGGGGNGMGGGMGGGGEWTPSPDCVDGGGVECGEGGGDGDGQGTGDKDGMGDKNEAHDDCVDGDGNVVKCGEGGGDGDGQGTGDKDGMGDKNEGTGAASEGAENPLPTAEPEKKKKKMTGLIVVIVLLCVGFVGYYTVRCRLHPKRSKMTQERFLNPLADGPYEQVQVNGDYSFGDDEEVFNRSSNA